MTELKPCPFCGGKPYIEHKGSKANGYVVVICGTCGAKSRGVLYKHEYLGYRDVGNTEEGQKLVALWNTRKEE